MSLLSSAQLNALSKLVAKGMDSDVLIYDRVIEESSTGTAESWVARANTVKGWLYTTVTPVMTMGFALQGTVNTLRLYLELGTDIEPGDRVRIAGETFTVSDTTAENTIQAMLTVSLRRIG